MTSTVRPRRSIPALRQSCSNHVAITQQSRSNHAAITQQSRSNHIAITWQSHSNHISITWQSHSNHVPITWQSHGNHICRSPSSGAAAAGGPLGGGRAGRAAVLVPAAEQAREHRCHREQGVRRSRAALAGASAWEAWAEGRLRSAPAHVDDLPAVRHVHSWGVGRCWGVNSLEVSKPGQLAAVLPSPWAWRLDCLPGCPAEIHGGPACCRSIRGGFDPIRSAIHIHSFPAVDPPVGFGQIKSDT